MATKTSTQDLANLVINRVESPTAFQQMVAAGQVNANELYLVEGDETVTYSISKSGGTITLTGSDGSTSTVTVPTATSDLTNDSGYITSSAVPSASTSTPAMDGTGAAGSSSAYARGDHVHPTDTSRAPTSHASTATTYGAGTSSNYGHLKLSASTTSTLGTSGGTAATPSAVKAVKDAIPTATSELTNDSGFITDAGVTSFNGSTGAITYTAPVTSVNGDTGAVTVTVPTATSDLTNDSGFITSSSVPSATTTTPKMDGTAAVGSETKWAKGDHVHPTDTSRAPTSHASTATTYGVGTGSNYGHLKLSDSTTSTSGTSGGVAATPAAVKAVMDAIPTATSDLTNDSGFITEDDLILPEIIGNADSGTTVTATYGSKTITGTATGGTFELKIPSYGTWSVSGTVDGGAASATVEVDAVKEYNVVLYPELEDASWAMISTAAQEGIAGNVWSIGDTKSVAISGTIGTLELNTTLNVYIIGINHGGVNGITFQGFRESNGNDVALIDSTYASYKEDGTKTFSLEHWSYYNYGGWKGCDMRYDILGSTDTAPSGYGAAPVSGSRVGYDASTTTATSPVSGTLMSALPSELRAVMRPMTVYTDNSSTGTHSAEATVTASVDYLPLLAEFEIFGARTNANQYEQNYQSQYDYYANGGSKRKYQHSSSTSAAYWWERSPLYNRDDRFCSVSNIGTAGGGDSYFSRGLTPIFLV